MKNIFSFFLLIMCSIQTHSQSFLSKEEILKISQIQTYRVVATFKNQQNKSLNEFGKGFILKGQYFVTCYHIISQKDTSFKFQSAVLILNERFENGVFKYDSLLLEKDFKPTNKQYDFRKHNYDPNKYETDIVVLKLPYKLNPIEYNFSLSSLNFRDTTYSLGNLKTDSTVNPAFQIGIYIMDYPQKTESKAKFYGCISYYDDGFSGTLTYNTKGMVVGMIQFSFKSLYPLQDYLNKSMISPQVFNIASNAFSQGYKIQFSIDFNYLKENYLNGYL